MTGAAKTKGNAPTASDLLELLREKFRASQANARPQSGQEPTS